MQKVLFLMLVLCCHQAHSKENVKLHGTITNPIADSISVSYDRTMIVYTPNTHYTKLNKDGSFSLEFSVPEGFTLISITHGNQRTTAYVQPGADLTLTLDAANFDSTVHYEGKGKELANFMAEYELMPMMERQGQKLCREEEPAGCEAGLKKLEKRELDFLHKHSANLPAGFAGFYKIDVRYRIYSIMVMYPYFHEMAKQKSKHVTNFPKEDYTVVNDVPQAFNDACINMPAYAYYYLSNYFSTRISAKMAGLNLPAEARPNTDSIFTLAYSEMPPKTAEYYIGSQLVQNLKYTSAEQAEVRYENYKKHFPHSKNLPVIEAEINRKKTFANGQPAIDFDITTPEGKQMKLSDLKGNVVYIDFWASWCAPCVGEMPASKKVRAYFKDKPVRFVYVSIDMRDEAWKKAMQQYEVEGINTRLENDTESPTAKKYNVKGIPDYFLVDKDGNFASSDDLARPSDTGKLIAQIEKLLK